jgi:hypothetical protein
MTELRFDFTDLPAQIDILDEMIDADNGKLN